MNPITPTQIGYVPYSSGNSLVSNLVFGRNTTGSWEAVGFGSQGRPDPLNQLAINLTDTRPSASISMPGIINIDVSDLLSVINAAGSQAPHQFSFKMREVAVCEENNGVSTEKRMMVLASQTYPAGS